MEGKRIIWVDNAKAYAIILVVLGHILTRTGMFSYEKILQIEIYSYHMHLFFFLSGFVYKENKIGEKLKKLGAPYLAFCVIYFLYYWLKSVVGSTSIEFTKEMMLNIVFMNNKSFFSAYWFLPVLICTQLIFDYQNKLANLLKNKLIQNLTIIVTTIIIFVLSRMLFSNGVVLPVGIGEAMGAFPFFASGYYLKKGKFLTLLIDNINPGGQNTLILSICLKVALIIAVVISINILQGYGLCNMYNSDIGNVFEYFLFATIGISGTILLSNSYTNRTITKIGKNTVWVYGIHYFFLDLFSSVINKLHIQNECYKALADITATALIVGFSMMIVIIIDIMKSRISN